ncbi:MAG: hypothetical protein Q9195_000692 [Heterodermia aff. obscurata]
MDSPQPQSSGIDSSESPTQKQARLRRERREAKIKAGGSSRLDKITQLSGRPAETPSNDPPFNPTALPAHEDATTPDPEEIDITCHPYTSRSPPKKHSRQSTEAPTEADVRALLRSGALQPRAEASLGRSQQQEDDPMMRLFQQLMGGIGGDPGSEGDGGLPSGLAAMLNGGAGDMDGMRQQQQGASSAAVNSSSYIWRMLHALYAMILGIYLVSHSSFVASSARLTASQPAGSSPASSVSSVVEADHPAVNMFWIFATAELVLQGSRLYLDERNDWRQGGWLQIIGGFLPEPWKGRVRLVGHYSGIWNTVVEDGMVIVFMLGIMGWWKGLEG